MNYIHRQAAAASLPHPGHPRRRHNYDMLTSQPTGVFGTATPGIHRLAPDAPLPTPAIPPPIKPAADVPWLFGTSTLGIHRLSDCPFLPHPHRPLHLPHPTADVSWLSDTCTLGIHRLTAPSFPTRAIFHLQACSGRVVAIWYYHPGYPPSRCRCSLPHPSIPHTSLQRTFHGFFFSSPYCQSHHCGMFRTTTPGIHRLTAPPFPTRAIPPLILQRTCRGYLVLPPWVSTV